MEFSTTPIEGSMKQVIATPRVMDQPTFEWLDAGARLSKEFFSFTLAVPAGFQGVASVRFDGEVLELREHGKDSVMKLQNAGFK